MNFKQLFNCVMQLSELLIRQKAHAGAISCYRDMIALAFFPGTDKCNLGVDELYAEVDKTISLSSSKGNIYINPDLNEIHGGNPRSFLNEMFGMVELMRNTEVIKSKPVSMIVSLTGRCNLNCIMCGEDKFKSWDIPISVVEEIKSLYPYLKSIQWRGGEAFLSPHFEGLVETAIKYPHLEQSLNTNGLLINETWAERLVRGNFHIIFSIDGIRQDTYETIRRGGSYEKLLNSLRLIKNTREKASSKTQVSMTFVVMKTNYNDLPYLVDFAKEYGIDELRVSKLAPYGEHNFYNESVFSDLSIYNEVKRYLREISVDAANNKIAFCNWFGDLGDDDVSKEPAAEEAPNDTHAVNLSKNNTSVKICKAPWQSLFINTGGDVFPYCFCATKLGNVSSESLSGIWNGKVMRSLRSPGSKCKPNTLSRCDEILLDKKDISNRNESLIEEEFQKFQKESNYSHIQSYFGAGEIEKADKLSSELMSVQQKGSEDPVLQLWSGRIKFRQKQHAEAAACFEKSLELLAGASNEEARTLREIAYNGIVEACLEAGETEKAETLAIKLLTMGENKAQDMIKYIKNQYKNNNNLNKSYEFGMKLYSILPEEYGSLRQETRDGGLQLIKEYVSRQEWEKARETCDSLLLKDGKNPIWHIWAGRISAGTKKYKESVSCFEKSLALLGDAEDNESGQMKKAVYYGIIQSYFDAGEIEKADKVSSELMSVEQKGSEDPVLQLWSGRIKFRQKQHAEAAACFEKSLELLAGASNEEARTLREIAYNGMVEACLEAGETEKAETLAIKLLTMGENKAQDMIKYIKNQYKNNNNLNKSYEFGMKLYSILPEEYGSLRQETRDGGLQLIKEYVSRQEWEKARETCDSLLLKDGKNPIWHIWAGRISAGTKKYKESVSCFEKSLALLGDAEDNESGQMKKAVYYGIIQSYFDAGEIEKADKVSSELMSVEQKGSEDPVLQLWRGRIKFRQKQYAEAAACLEKSLELLAGASNGEARTLREIAYNGMVEACLEAGETDKTETIAIKLLLREENKAKDLINRILTQYKNSDEIYKRFQFGMKLYSILPEEYEYLRRETRDDGLRLIEEYVSRQEWEDAQEIYGGLLAKDKNNAAWHIWAGRIKAGMAKYEEAGGSFRERFGANWGRQ